MKNTLLYYFLLIVPAAVLIIFWETLPARTLVILLLTYVFIYRTLLDGYKLYSQGVIEKKEIWKLAIPGMRGKYLKELYLKH